MALSGKKRKGKLTASMYGFIGMQLKQKLDKEMYDKLLSLKMLCKL